MKSFVQMLGGLVLGVLSGFAAFGRGGYSSPGPGQSSANERYLERLASVEHAKPLHELIEPLGRRVMEPSEGGRKLRDLSPLVGSDAALLEAVARPEFLLNGLRNRDVVITLDRNRPTSPQSENGVWVR